MRFEFSELESLRLFVRQLQQDRWFSLQYFAHGDGFEHFKGKSKVSVSAPQRVYSLWSLPVLGRLARKEPELCLGNLLTRKQVPDCLTITLLLSLGFLKQSQL